MKRRGRKKKTVRDIRATYSAGEPTGRIYFEWHAYFSNAKRRMTDRRARGEAFKVMERRFKKSRRRIEQIVSEGDALFRTLEMQASERAAKQAAHTEEFRALYSDVYEAASLLKNQDTRICWTAARCYPAQTYRTP
jgi:hypothetical protein